MRVLKFAITSAYEIHNGPVKGLDEMIMTAVFVPGSRTLTLTYTTRGMFVFSGGLPAVEVHRANDNAHTPARFTVDSVRKFVDSGWYVAREIRTA